MPIKYLLIYSITGFPVFQFRYSKKKKNKQINLLSKLMYDVYKVTGGFATRASSARQLLSDHYRTEITRPYVKPWKLNSECCGYRANASTLDYYQSV